MLIKDTVIKPLENNTCENSNHTNNNINEVTDHLAIDI